MFTLDERIKTLPAKADAVALLYQSINAPHIGIPGKQAGPAQAYIVGFKGSNGHGLFVYLSVADGADCAVYACEKRNMTADELASEENEAMGFVESMGFMMDNLNFRNLPPDQQEELLRTLPPFTQGKPKPGPAAVEPKAAAAQKSPALQLGRILSSF